jgi:hypothetical protein
MLPFGVEIPSRPDANQVISAKHGRMKNDLYIRIWIVFENLMFFLVSSVSLLEIVYLIWWSHD